MVSALGGIGNNAGVGSEGMFGLRERVGVRGHELAFVVGASVTNDNLGGVLVGHNNGRGRQTGAMGQWGVRLKGLPGHTSVQVGAHLEHVSGQGSSLGALKCSDVDRLGVGIVESNADGVSAFHQYTRARGDASILEVGVGPFTLVSVEISGVLHVLVDHGVALVTVHGLSSSTGGSL